MNDALNNKESWRSCSACGMAMTAARWRELLQVCPQCGYHRRLAVLDRIHHVVDQNSFNELDANLIAGDPLAWRVGDEVYSDMLKAAQASSKSPESFRYGKANIGGKAVYIGGFEFNFLGGTLGSVAGEKVARLLEASSRDKAPAIIFTTSGGARMQEGMISLMQMAKNATALALLNQARVPLITILCDPTTGGVAASLAFMGDVVLAEPGALVGFAGPRVILQTIGEEIPPGIQTSDRLCQDGFIDQIVPRSKLRAVLIKRLEALAA